MLTLAANNRLETLWNEVKRNSIIPHKLSYETKHQLLSNRLEVKREASPFGNIIGVSPLLQKVNLQARRASQFSSTNLIEGESGTGKEMVPA